MFVSHVQACQANTAPCGICGALVPKPQYPAHVQSCVARADMVANASVPQPVIKAVPPQLQQPPVVQHPIEEPIEQLG